MTPERGVNTIESAQLHRGAPALLEIGLPQFVPAVPQGFTGIVDQGHSVGGCQSPIPHFSLPGVSYHVIPYHTRTSDSVPHRRNDFTLHAMLGAACG